MFHIVLPWGHLVAYMYRPEIKCNNGPFNETRYDIPAERVWKKFLEGDNVSLALNIFRFTLG